jgi:tetratricopeptide (TPR) repeat protein
MEKSRLELLREIVQNAPDDTFARYGLAMELSNSGKPTEAWQHFDYLLAHHPNYSPTYYQAGKLLAGQGRREEARRVLAKGIEVTAQKGESHAQSELEAALEQLPGDGR